VGSAPATFAVFANSTQGDGVPEFPDIARVHIRFYQGTGTAADGPRKKANKSG